MKITVFILVSMLALAGCAGASQQVQGQFQQAFAKEEAARRASMPKFFECAKKYSKGDMIVRAKAVEFETCKQAVIKNEVLPHAVYADLMLDMLVENKKIAIDYKKGRIDRDEANVRKEKTEADYIKQIQARYQQSMGQALQYDMNVAQQRQQALQNLSNQVNQAEMQRQQNMPQNTNCHVFGNNMNCTTW